MHASGRLQPVRYSTFQVLERPLSGADSTDRIIKGNAARLFKPTTEDHPFVDSSGTVGAVQERT